MDIPEFIQRVLIVDDEEWSREYLRTLLENGDERVSIEEAENGEDAVERINRSIYDLIITDLNMPGDINGMGVLKAAKLQPHDPEVMLVTGYAAVDTAVEALKQGASDYLTKPFDSKRVLLSIRQALEKKTLKREVALLRKQIEANKNKRNLIALSPAMNQVISVVNMVAPSDASVLIEGENGSGKEVIARMIHDESLRRDRPFVAVNCGALPAGLLESELFGHVKGAFTGADKDKKGFFEEADKGTLLLDEIGDLPLPLQVKLLRVLQEGVVHKVGSSKETPVDVRVISATNCDLWGMVGEKKFREDLYYRLHVVPLRIPPLRERKEDILPLAKLFLAQFDNGAGSKEKRLSSEILTTLLEYSWPGNVRQLENVIRGAIAISPDVEIKIGIINSLLHLNDRKTQEPDKVTKSDHHLASVQNSSEREHILNILKECDGNKSFAAEKLGISRTTLWRKMNALKIFQGD